MTHSWKPYRQDSDNDIEHIDDIPDMNWLPEAEGVPIADTVPVALGVMEEPTLSPPTQVRLAVAGVLEGGRLHV